MGWRAGIDSTSVLHATDDFISKQPKTEEGRRLGVEFGIGREQDNVQLGEGCVQPWLLHDGSKPVESICQDPSTALRLADGASLVNDQVSRMLRTTERDERDVREFYMVHPQAKERGFGRVFRYPSLFEDAVKSILLCNCTFTKCNKKTIQKQVREVYDNYSPFQCLAYGMELLEYYENKFGKLSKLPESSYQTISAAYVKPRL